jgi:hypothetical protein
MMTDPRKQTPEQRIENMALWAAKVDKQLAALSQVKAQAAPGEPGEALVALAALHNDYTGIPAALRQLRQDMVAAKAYYADVAAELDEAEARAMLDVSMQIDGNGKPLHSNEAARKAAVKVALAGSDIPGRLRQAEAAMKAIEVEIEYQSDLLAEFSRRSRALVSVVDYATATLNHAKGA